MLTGEWLRTGVCLLNRNILISNLREEKVWLIGGCMVTEGDCSPILEIVFEKKLFNFHTQIFCCVTSILFFLSQLYKFTWLVPYLSITNFLLDPFLNNATTSSLNSSSFDFPAPRGLPSFTPFAFRALNASFVLLLSKLSVQRKVDKVRK